MTQAARRQPSRPDSASQVAYTVSPLLFETCGCLLDTSSSLTLGMIERLGTRRPTTTYITFAEWRSFARETASLKDATITALFDAFHTLSSRTENRVESSRLLLGKMGGTVEETRYRTAAGTRVVSLPSFSLFLMAQTHLQSSRDGENPSEILAFVRQHIVSMVTIVGITRAGYVTHKDMTEMGLLLREFERGAETLFASAIAGLWREERALEVGVVAQHLKSRLVRPDEMEGIVGNIAVTGSNSAMQVLNAPLGPQPIRLPGYTFRIQSASQTNFFVTSVLPSTTLASLSNCVVQLGPVSGVLRVNGCENCAISAMCGSIIVSNCRNVTLFICTNTPPIVVDAAGLDTVAFAPYNTHYATLEDHIATSGLNPKLNLWRVGLPDTMVLPPSRFLASSFPTAPTGGPTMVTRTNPCPLPREYQEALTQRVNSFNSTSSMLQASCRQLEAAGRKDLADNLRHKVQSMFTEWAYSKGQLRSLVDLLQNNTHASE